MSVESSREPERLEPAPSPGPAVTQPRSHGYESDGLGEDEVHLSDYVRVLYKRRWTAITVFLIVVLSVAAYTFTATPIYQASVQILIEKESTNIVSFKEAFEQNQITDDYYQTQYKVLQSRALARRTLDELKLWDHPRFNPARDKSLTLGTLVAAPVALVSGWFKGDTPGESPLVDETQTQSTSIDRFLADLTVSPLRNTRLVDVRFRSPDSALSANVANALAQGYIEQNLEFKFLSSKEASDWLGQQLADQRKQVEGTEQALQRYREGTDAVSLEDRQNIVVQKLADLNAAVTRARIERIQKEAAYNQIGTLQNDRAALDTFPAIFSNTFIQEQKGELADLQRQQAQLSEKLGPRHPDIVKFGLAVQSAEAKIQAEIAKVAQSMRNDYQQSLAQERSLTSALEQQKSEALELNRKGIEYGALAREAASNRQIFDSLMQRTKETGISGDLKTSNVRIVDAAETPRRPASPNTPMNLLLALFGGTTLAAGLAFFFEYLDSTIKSPADVERHLRLPCLGMVPALFDKTITNPLITHEVPAHFAECFRALRTSLLFSSAEEGIRSVVVTSAAPGEGKTVVSTNVAVALAQAGQRVLILDADMRRPRVHVVFDKPQKPGLSNILVGDAKASEAIDKTTVPGLWVIPAGLAPPNPAELLGSKRFTELMASFENHFDWVIIDMPPIMPVTDASVVAQLATSVLFVISADKTSRQAAQHAIRQLEHARAKFSGAVLNRVDLEHNSYYYSQYYRREHSDYYQKDTGT